MWRITYRGIWEGIMSKQGRITYPLPQWIVASLCSHIRQPPNCMQAGAGKPCSSETGLVLYIVIHLHMPLVVYWRLIIQQQIAISYCWFTWIPGIMWWLAASLSLDNCLYNFYIKSHMEKKKEKRMAIDFKPFPHHDTF